MQAPSLPELKTLRKQVETKIKGAKAKPMLARKEMWEAYVSCMGIADDRLTKRYARKGFLSEPLADFDLSTTDGGGISKSDFAGERPLLLVFSSYT